MNKITTNYLLEKPLWQMTGEEFLQLAHSIYGLPVLLNHFGKLKFNVVHQISVLIYPLDTKFTDSFQKI